MKDVESVRDIATGSKAAGCKLFLQRMRDVAKTARAAAEVSGGVHSFFLPTTHSRPYTIVLPLCLHCQGMADPATVLQQLDTLFQGSFVGLREPLLKDQAGCRVVRAKLKTGVDAVVKITSNADAAAKARAAREIKLLRMFQDLKAQHICGFRDDVVTPAYSAVVLECMELGTVQDFLDMAPGEYTITDPAVAGGATRLRLQSIVNLCVDVLAGLVVMHGQGVCHRDIKPANIGVTHMPTLGRVGYKIIDLGIAVAETPQSEAPPHSFPALPSASAAGAVAAPPRNNFMTGICTGLMELKNLRGTPLFMSPEQLDEKRAVSSTRLCGCTMLLFATRWFCHHRQSASCACAGDVSIRHL